MMKFINIILIGDLQNKFLLSTYPVLSFFVAPGRYFKNQQTL